MLKISQYPRNADGTPMDIEVGVLTDTTGDNGAQMPAAPVGPDNAPIPTKAYVLVDIGGNLVPLLPEAMTLALFSTANTKTVPIGTTAVRTTGYWTTGVGAALYFYDPTVDAAYVAAHPNSSFMSLNNRGFRLDTTFGFEVDAYGARGAPYDDTTAFQAASADLCEEDGGLFLCGGNGKTYIVGTQTFSGAAGRGYSYAPTGLGAVVIANCTKPVIIDGRGATITYPNGYKYGSFDPVTGVRYDPALPFNNTDYQARMFDGMVRLEDNTGPITVRNLDLEGNNATVVLGGQYGDSGRQCPGSGIFSNRNLSVTLSHVKSNSHPLDGWLPWYDVGLTKSTGSVSFAMDCEFLRNGRQGLSWCGGNALTAIRCKFNDTGRGGVNSAPAAGLDIEPTDLTFCRKGHFIDCEFSNNVGMAALANNGDVSDVLFTRCRFVGTDNAALWVLLPRFAFEDCTFVGSIVNTYGNADPGLATKFRSCRFTADTAESPTGAVYFYAGFLLNLGGVGVDQNVLFDSCEITTGGNLGGLAIFTGGAAIFRNINIHQDDDTTLSYPRGYWYGNNIADGLFDFGAGSVPVNNFGRVIYNGTVYEHIPQGDDITPPSGTYTVHGTLASTGYANLAGGLQIGETDYSHGILENYNRSGSAYVIDHYLFKKADGTVVEAATDTAISPDFGSVGRRIQGLGGVNIGTIATYNTCLVDDTSVGLSSATATFKVGGISVLGSRKTGWAADTGTAKRTANATYAAGAALTFSAAYTQSELNAAAARIAAIEAALQNLSQTQKALKDDFIQHGAIGA